MAAEETLENFDPQAQLRQGVALAKRHAFFLGTMVMVGLLLGIGVFLFLPKEYDSQAKIMIRSGWMLDSRETIGEKQPVSVRANILDEQVKSTLWLEAVLDRLEWPEWARVRQNPAESRQFVTKIKSRVAVQMAKGETGERLVFLKFHYPDAYKARDFVSALLDHWLSEVVDAHRRDLDREVAQRAQLADEKNVALQRSRKDLEDFEINSGISRLAPAEDYQRERDLWMQKLSDAEQERIQLSAQESNLEARLKEVDDEGRLKLPAQLPAEHQIENPDFLGKTQLLAQHLAEVEALQLRNFTEKHPSMIAARDRLQKVLESLVDVPETLTVQEEAKENPDWRAVVNQLEEKRSLLEGLKAREDHARAQLEDVEQVLATLPPKLSRLEELQFAKQAAEDAVLEARMLLGPLRDQRDALARLGATDALPYSRLEEPEAAFKPSVAMGLFGFLVALGLFSGIGVAWVVATELFKTSYGSSDQVRRGLKIPVLGEVGIVLTAAEARRVRAQRKLQVVASVMLLAGLAATVYLCSAHSDLLPSWVLQGAGKIREGLL